MLTADFDFHLPPERIATRPATPRDSARLLHVTATGLADHGVRDLPALLSPGDVLVFNDTRVLPARLNGRRGAARVSVTLLRRLTPGPDGEEVWRALAKPARKLRPGDLFEVAADLHATVRAREEDGAVVLAFHQQGAPFAAALEAHGHMPLPPYMGREDDGRDREDYQTVFARTPGAVAAPTAGLHFTPALLAALAARSVRTASVTLHVGAGTFLPVKTERAADHPIHSEWGQVPPETVAAVADTRARGGRVVAVGTTALRLLETAADGGGGIVPFHGDTDIFILPGYRFQVVDRLLTNFHLPRSTLFMLVCAFRGVTPMRAAYAHAIAAGYRFYSYGDACLLERGPVDERTDAP